LVRSLAVERTERNASFYEKKERSHKNQNRAKRDESERERERKRGFEQQPWNQGGVEGKRKIPLTLNKKGNDS